MDGKAQGRRDKCQPERRWTQDINDTFGMKIYEEGELTEESELHDQWLNMFFFLVFIYFSFGDIDWNNSLFHHNWLICQNFKMCQDQLQSSFMSVIYLTR